MNKNDSTTEPNDARRPAAKHAHGHAPQPSKTLMRHAVHKPSKSLKRTVKAVGLAKQAGGSLVKPSAHRFDDIRLQHARHIKKSPLVKRFNKLEPVIMPSAPVQPFVGPRSFADVHRPAHAAKQPQTTAELLQHALELASSHEAPAVKPRSRSLAKRIASRRITGISSLVVAAFLLVGLVSYANSTAIRLHVASSHAGFAVSLPGYKPAGYRLSHMNYSPGNVAIEFQSNSDNRRYAITEQASAWDSQTLRDDFLAGVGQDYQAVQTAGRTVYVYGQQNATWVSGGVWYQIKSGGALSLHQVVQLASSM